MILLSFKRSIRKTMQGGSNVAATTCTKIIIATRIDGFARSTTKPAVESIRK
jgi:hypothetical protein